MLTLSLSSRRPRFLDRDNPVLLEGGRPFLDEPHNLLTSGIWKFISLDRSEHRIVFEAVDDGLHKLISRELYLSTPNMIVPLLTRTVPLFDSSTRPKKKSSLLLVAPWASVSTSAANTQPNENAKNLQDLPVEILHLIFERLPSTSAVCLALSSRYMCMVGEYDLKKRIRGLMGTWANTRVTRFAGWCDRCNQFSNSASGTKATRFDTPTTPLQFAETDPRVVRPGALRESISVTLPSGNKDAWTNWSFKDLSSSFDGRLHVNPKLQIFVDEMMNLHKSEMYNALGAEERRKVKSMLNMTAHDLWPADKKWILRNLNRRCFVRAEALALSPDHVSGPFVAGFGFGHLLGYFADYEHWAIDAVKGFRSQIAGSWFGDRFDIVTTEMHEKECAKEQVSQPWKDVSETAVMLLHRHISESFDPDWENLVKLAHAEMKARDPDYLYNSSGLLSRSRRRRD